MSAALHELAPMVDIGIWRQVEAAVAKETPLAETDLNLCARILIEAGVTDVVNSLRLIASVMGAIQDDPEKVAMEMKLSDTPAINEEEATEKVRLTVQEEGTPKAVMTALTKGPTVRDTKANGTEGTLGTTVQKLRASGHNGTLGVDLGGMIRLPKPRSVKEINELKWAQSQQIAMKEITEEFCIPSSPEDYYEKMCMVGQKALVAAIHTKTQAIYDATMTNLVKRQNKKKK